MSRGRNPVAKALRSPHLRQRVVPDKRREFHAAAARIDLADDWTCPASGDLCGSADCVHECSIEDHEPSVEEDWP